MFKAIFLFLNLFTLSSDIKIDNKSLYQPIIEESIENKEILIQRENYLLYIERDKIYLSKGDLWIVELSIKKEELINYKVFIKDSKFLLFYVSKSKLHLIEYGQDSKLITNKVLIDNVINDNFNILVNESVYIVGSVSIYNDDSFLKEKVNKEFGEKDAFIIKFSKDYQIETVKLYGGVLNEEFLFVVSDGEYIYINGIKDPLSGGDFGNGGRIENVNFVLKLNLDLSINHFIILSNNESIIMFEVYKDYLYLVSETYIYKLSSDLGIVKKVGSDAKFKFSIIALFNKIICLVEENIIVYDIFSLKLEENLKFDLLKEVYSVQKQNQIIRLVCHDKSYLFDLAYLGDFIVYDKYRDGVENSLYVRTIFGDAILKDNSETSFNPNIHGSYNLKYIYKNAYGLDFNIERVVQVEMRANVRENGIYPIGYKLNFTGTAYLNGSLVVNNQAINNVGSQLLELYGYDNSKVEIRFVVDRDQIKFEQSPIIYWDYEVTRAKDLFIKIKLANLEKLEVVSIQINGKDYKNLITSLETNTITLKLNLLAELDVHDFVIEELKYIEDSVQYSYPINEVITVKVIDQIPKIFIDQVDKDSYLVNINDDLGKARSLKLIIQSSSGERIVYYSLSNHNLLLEGLDIRLEYRVSLFLVFDLGRSKESVEEIFEASITGISSLVISEINIIKKTEKLSSFQIDFNNLRDINSLEIANKVVVDAKEHNYKLTIVLSAFIFIASIPITYIVIKKKISIK